MRYLVISDVHANLEALEAVLEAGTALNYDRLLVLGDLVGYGADPNQVIERIRGLEPHAIIRGNHDKVGAGIESPEGFNAVAKSAIRWTYEALTPENREWLAQLPAGPIQVDELLEICHGTPFDEDAYVFDDLDALRAIHAAHRPVCLFGHTHVQVGYRLEADQFALTTADDRRPLNVVFNNGARHLVNPGSVGQPRDLDPRASYAILDVPGDGPSRVEFYRLDYDVKATVDKILAIPELSDWLGERLYEGR